MLCENVNRNIGGVRVLPTYFNFELGATPFGSRAVVEDAVVLVVFKVGFGVFFLILGYSGDGWHRFCGHPQSWCELSAGGTLRTGGGVGVGGDGGTLRSVSGVLRAGGLRAGVRRLGCLVCDLRVLLVGWFTVG